MLYEKNKISSDQDVRIWYVKGVGVRSFADQPWLYNHTEDLF